MTGKTEHLQRNLVAGKASFGALRARAYVLRCEGFSLSFGEDVLLCRAAAFVFAADVLKEVLSETGCGISEKDGLMAAKGAE